nr:HD domain-containing phosphohydrolase [bacterium]
GPLTEDERACMQTHTTIGAKILENSEIDILDTARLIALHHHERWDGSGYPAGLRRDTIPLEARIVSVADVFDALASRRPYKEPIPLAMCRKIICDDSPGAFDPDIVSAFEKCFPQIQSIQTQYRD